MAMPYEGSWERRHLAGLGAGPARCRRSLLATRMNSRADIENTLKRVERPISPLQRACCISSGFQPAAAKTYLTPKLPLDIAHFSIIIVTTIVVTIRG